MTKVPEASGKWKRVVRHGKLVRKLICPDGYKASDGKCIKMSPAELRKRRLAAKKAARKNKAKATQIARKRIRTMKKFGENSRITAKDIINLLNFEKEEL